MDNGEKYMGLDIVTMITALSRYCQIYRDVFDSPIGDDAILGDEGVRDILRGLNTLLNGPLGQQDGGKLSQKLHQIAKEHGLADENGEF